MAERPSSPRAADRRTTGVSTARGLLERDQVLGELSGLAIRARDGHGATVLLSGEAGLGKTSVLKALRGLAPSRMRHWTGTCEPRTTPAPLGPLLEIAEEDPRVRRLLTEDAPAQLAPRLAELLAGPTLAVVEDIHWMDDSTGDLLAFLARRMERTRSLLVVTHRDDPADASPALRRFLSAVVEVDGVHRLTLDPLSRRAVARLAAGSAVDVDELYRRTGGNPFYVTEVLADPVRAVPDTVGTAVLLRADRFSTVARELLDLTALAPEGLERDVAEAVLGESAFRLAIKEALDQGMLAAVGGRLQFRHELARSAVESAVRPGRMLSARRRLLDVLEARPGADPSRMAYHGAMAGDTERLRRYAPAAAASAIRRGSYRAAVEHVESVLALGEMLDGVERAELLDLLADAREELDTPAEVASLRMRASAHWQQLGHPAHAAQQTALAAGSHYIAGDVLAAMEALDWADGLVSGMPIGPQVAVTVAARLAAQVVLDPPDVALAAADRAAAEVEEVDAPRAQSKILQCRAVLRIITGQLDAGVEDGWRSIDIAHWSLPHVVPQRTWHVAETLVATRQSSLAMEFIDHGQQHAETRDRSSYEVDLRVLRARALLQRGDLSAAAALAGADATGSWERSTALMRLVAFAVTSARLGRAEAVAALQEAHRLAEDLLHLPARWPVAAAAAELAWLRDDGDAGAQVGRLTGPVLERALAARQPWATGELRYWRWRTGSDDGPVPGWVAEPWRLMLTGYWAEAAEAWQRLEAPYERALALMAGDEAARREALGILDSLGAVPLADRVRGRLRKAGADHLPARPRASGPRLTRQLTVRQLEVLRLLAEGLTNAQIARRLSITAKTTDHHVSAILERLDVGSRTEAVSTGIRVGLLEQHG